MKIGLPLCLLLACSAMASGDALAVHYHRPNPAAAQSGTATGDVAKSSVTPSTPADAAPPVAGSNTGDTAPIDTSITVNQGHRILTAKEAATKRLRTELGKLVPAQDKPHPPAHPFTAHVAAHRNAVGAVVQHADPRTTGKRAVVASGASAPAKPAPQPGAAATAPATPATHDIGGIGAPAPKSPAAISAGNNEHGAAVLKIVTANGPSINGTGIAKPSMATAAVGGPAKTVAAAAVGGSSFRPKHP